MSESEILIPFNRFVLIQVCHCIISRKGQALIQVKMLFPQRRILSGCKKRAENNNKMEDDPHNNYVY